MMILEKGKGYRVMEEDYGPIYGRYIEERETHIDPQLWFRTLKDSKSLFENREEFYVQKEAWIDGRVTIVALREQELLAEML